MNLTDNRLIELDNPVLTNNERIFLRCRLSSEFIHTGQYEIARDALGDLWRGVGERPDVDRLKNHIAAEVLLQCGVLSGWLGNSQRISGAQEKANDLLFEARRVFDSEREYTRVAEAEYELGMCYFRLGAYDDARVFLDKSLNTLNEEEHIDLRAKILIRQTIIEVWTGRYHDAWNILTQAEEFFERCSDDVKGRWHGQKALVLQRLALTEKRTDFADRAIVEFTAAIFHFEQSKHERYCATNLNNLAMLLYQLGRYGDAHSYLDKAEAILQPLHDEGFLASVTETRVRVFVAEGYYQDAARLITSAIGKFEKSNEYGMLADALTLQGLIFSRLDMHDSSIQTLRHAVTIAQDSGAYSNAGLAALTLIEEHGKDRLSEAELYRVYLRTDELLKDTKDIEETTRLLACARIVAKRLVGVRTNDENFILPKVMHEHEAKFIREALEAENGMVTRAAKRLGLRHQAFIRALETRHRDLLELRTSVKPRRKSIMRKR